jgi:hypothetical protein
MPASCVAQLLEGDPGLGGGISWRRLRGDGVVDSARVDPVRIVSGKIAEPDAIDGGRSAQRLVAAAVAVE